MKKILTLAVAILALGASSAMAQGGLNLFWDGCSDGGTSSKTFACNTNTGAAFSMYASLVLPGDMPLFLGTTAILDIGFTGTSIPAYWQTGLGECRQNSLAVSYDPNAFVTNCIDIWGGAVPLSVAQLQPGTNGANKLRYNSGAVVPSGQEISLVADGTELVVCKFTVNRAKTVGTGACAGCDVGACIVLNECKAQQPGGVGDRTITNPAVSNFVSWQAGAPACPQATPALNRTWGSVKNLYR